MSFDLHRAYQTIWTRLASYRNIDPLCVDAHDPFHRLFLKALEAHLEAERQWHETLRRNGTPAAGAFLAADLTKFCVAMERAIVPDAAQPPLVGATFEKTGWLDIGLSALALELLSAHVGTSAPLSFERKRFEAMADGFAVERRFALHARASEGREIQAEIGDFVIPAVQMHGDDFLREARHVLSGRLPKRTVLHAVIDALREAGLSDDPWLYLEPQLTRHGHVFDLKLAGVVGHLKKFAIKKAVKMLANPGKKGGSDVE